MQVNVAALRRTRGGQQTFHISATPEPFTYQGATVEFQSPAEIDVTVRNAGRGLEAHVEADLEARLTCDRCLATYRWPLHVAYDELYVTAEEAAAHRAAGEDGEGDVRRATYAGDVLDLEEGLRQSVIMALPMKKLCRQDCRGLCPKCGRNLNTGACTCADERVDPRLSALRQWFDGSDE